MLHQFRREGQASPRAGRGSDYTLDRAGFPLWLALGTILQGWALAEQGQGEEGIAQIRQGLAAYRATGAELTRSVFSCPAGRGVWESGTGRGRAELTGRGAGCGGQNWGAVLRGGAVSAQGRADAATVARSVQESKQSQPSPKQKPKRVFSRPSRLPASSKRSRWNCARR